MSSLEAGVMGANLVITDKGDTRDYFGDLAHYCFPDSLPSIRDAVLAAHHEPRKSALRERILERFTWRKAAEATLAAYQAVIGARVPLRVSFGQRGSSRLDK